MTPLGSNVISTISTMYPMKRRYLELKMNRKTLFYLVTFFTVFIASCSETEIEAEAEASTATSVSLPLADAGSQRIESVVTFWLWEGDAGCFGELDISGKTINVWAEADLCVDEEVQEGSKISIDIALESEKQSYISADGTPTYSVVGF